jgi:hypothetical protein
VDIAEVRFSKKVKYKEVRVTTDRMEEEKL